MDSAKDHRVSEETRKLISSLPLHTDSQGDKMCNYQGCWYYYNLLQGVLNFQKGFKPQETDIILASYPKTGTTWLKALMVSLLERSKNHSLLHHDHPLLSNNPHGIVPFLELDLYYESSSPDLTKFPISSPRLLSTHMPLHAMQENLKDTPCKIVYVCRNIKDTLVSWLFFRCAINKIEPSISVLEDVFEDFCGGFIFFGPFWDHILSYWRASLENPKNVLFMRYEEIKEKPHDEIKRLASFLDCSFTKEEEESGLVDKILDLCSLRNLSGLDVNKKGKKKSVDHNLYFRKGEVGDWKNYLTQEMENKIDMIIQEKLQGSGLKF